MVGEKKGLNSFDQEKNGLKALWEKAASARVGALCSFVGALWVAILVEMVPPALRCLRLTWNYIPQSL